MRHSESAARRRADVPVRELERNSPVCFAYRRLQMKTRTLCMRARIIIKQKAPKLKFSGMLISKMVGVAGLEPATSTL